MTQFMHPKAQRSEAVFDELLVMMAQQGDNRAFERLHQRWHQRLGRAALRYTGSADTARDLSQDCWLAIWKGLGRLRDPKRFRSYAFGVLHRRGADHLRGTMQARARIAPEDTAPEPSEPARQSDGSALNQAFALLPPDQRLAAHLHFVEGLTLSEIAEAQSIPAGTAKTRLFHARRKLKAALTDQPQGDA
ncbi:MAG: RNA polymerase sigma factor [Pseudomonadota bacterium]